MVTLRLLHEDDLDPADAVMTAAYGPGERKERLRRYRALQPDGWFVACDGDRIVGLGGALCYGELAYLGLMSVLPEAQRRGIGQALVERILAWLAGLRCPCVLLDASAAGAPLYRRLGFVEDEPTHVYARAASTAPNHAERLPPWSPAEVTPFDTEAFGAPRGPLLDSYGRDFQGLVCRAPGGQVEGYAVVQASVLGPLVARSPAAAERLLDAANGLRRGFPTTLLIPGSNAPALALAAARGFAWNRTLSHMRLGGSGPPGRRAWLYGRGSFVVG